MNQLALDLTNTPEGGRSIRRHEAPPGRKAEPARARRSDPATSHAAAARAANFAASHEGKILAALEQGPATFKEIASRTGLDPHAVARRLPYMGRFGVDKTDDVRDGCTVWARS